MSEKCTNLYFDKIKPLGNNEGRNSIVYLAKDKQLNADLVIKEVLKKSFVNEDDYFAESRCLYASKHPNIMEIQYASQDDNCIYFAMPYHKKGSLNALIEQRFLTVREIIKYSLDFLSGLHHVHSKKLIHFDIKPTNIIINDSNKALLTDFGLSRHTNEHGIAYQDSFYNFHRAPECFTIGSYSSLVDIYQVGVTLYRLCNGGKCLEEQIEKQGINNLKDLEIAVNKGLFPDRTKYLPHIPVKLQKIINKSMAVNPIDRYSSILDVINGISAIEENLDWVYNEYENKNLYSICDDTYTYEVEVLRNKDSSYSILTRKKNIETNKDSKISKSCKIDIDKICKTKYNTKKEAFKEVVKLLKELP